MVPKLRRCEEEAGLQDAYADAGWDGVEVLDFHFSHRVAGVVQGDLVQVPILTLRQKIHTLNILYWTYSEQHLRGCQSEGQRQEWHTCIKKKKRDFCLCTA